MKYILIFIISAAATLLVGAFALYLPARTSGSPRLAGVDFVHIFGEVETTSSPDPDTGEPVRLRIPILGIDAAVQPVGRTSAGDMSPPYGINQFREVGWYKLGPRPGEAGSAVMDGHLDNALSLRGVFYNLHDLRPGDELSVVTADGTQAIFKVRESRVYDYKDASAHERVFISDDGRAHLNLVTCGGAWIQIEKSYEERLVVFTDLVGFIPLEEESF